MPTNDENLRADLRAAGICADLGPPTEAGVRGYICSLKLDHPGAHAAMIAATVVDTWPSNNA
jgi:hypothetical protein